MIGPQVRLVALLATASALLLLHSGCGRKGAPRPATEVLPETITDLTSRITPAGIQLTWSRPTKYTGGDRMPDLGGFLIQRSAGDTFEFETVATIDVTDRERFQQTKRFRHLDGIVVEGREYRYRVVSFTLDRYFGAPSNIVVVRYTPERAATGSVEAPE
jgi:hypothetical protein